MTRAALLPLLIAPEALSAAAVQDLEQLAQAFPYCQTAHLLLAKAAHDQGSMLASQRLRRAATYAADRQLLRQLLEQPALLPVAPIADVPAVAEAPENRLELQPQPEYILPLAMAQVAEPETVSEQQVPLSIENTEAVENSSEVAGPISLPDLAQAPADEGLELLLEAEVASLEEKATPPGLEAPLAGAFSSPELTPAPIELTAAIAEQTVLLPSEPTAAVPDELESQTSVEEALTEEISETPEAQPEATVTEPEEQEQPPLPIQPSVEAGTARFEFGLSTALAAEFTAYRLVEPVPEATVAPVGSRSIAKPTETTAFIGVPDLVYALGGGSRLGYAMQQVMTDENPTWGSALNTPGSALPPDGEFFEPDALVVEYLANQPTPAPPAPSSLELIDSFLRRTPQRRRGIVSLLTVAEQTDLSMRSTRAEPDLASENLARILAGQGKIDRAISVYERLMVRQPEKSAYFAVQIELLRNPPTPSS